MRMEQALVLGLYIRRKSWRNFRWIGSKLPKENITIEDALAGDWIYWPPRLTSKQRAALPAHAYVRDADLTAYSYKG